MSDHLDPENMPEKKTLQPQLYNLAIKKNLPSVLEDKKGNITVACQSVGISRETYRLWYHSDPEFKALCDEARDNGRELRLDNAESALDKNIAEGKENSIFYALNNQGESRGYGKKMDGPTINHNAIDLSTLNDDQLKALIERYKDQ